MLLSEFSDGGDKSRRKSFANPENIENFDKNLHNNLRLEEKIKLHHLEQLMHHFHNHAPSDIIIRKDCGYFTSSLVEKREPGCMNKQEFKETLAKVLDTEEYNDYIHKLFTKLDTSCDGYVDWNEFCTYLLLLYRENDYVRTKKDIPFLQEPKIRHVVPNRQEPTTKILSIDSPLRYLTISKEGALTVWTTSLILERSYNIAGNDEVDTNGTKRRFKMWVTDAIFMANCNKIVVGTSSRDLRFYDVSTNHYFEDFHLFGMSDIPYCFDYWFDKNNINSESLLVCGLDSGTVGLFYFKRPVTQLFETPFKNDTGALKVFMQDLKSQHSKWVRYTCLTSIHTEMIRQVKYLPDNATIISSSGCPNSSLVISDINRFKQTYVFKLPKGVECFDYSKTLNVLVSGSADHNVQVWNPYMTSKPVAILRGHTTGIVGIALHDGLTQIFSYSRDAVIKVWDLREHKHLQTVAMKFPSSMHGRMPEHGQFPVCLLTIPSQSCLLVTCNDYLGQLSLGNTAKCKKIETTTHETPLSCALYNQFFKQVVTGCDSSAVAVWDIETGSKAIVFSNAHGSEEITSMKFDASWRRLLTGARNGTIKVWNFQNGHNLHKLEPVSEAEITGLLALNDRKVILAVGWSRLITMYDDSDPDNMYITADVSWKGGQLHEDDISAMAFCPPNILATASYDGALLIWNLETEKLLLRFRIATPIEKVHFLCHRAAILPREGATLISSGAGTLRWWNLYTEDQLQGSFYVPSTDDESVIALATNSNDEILLTGDTKGFIQVWDIKDYCIQNTPTVKTDRPKQLHVWKGHEGAIVSVEYVEHDTGCFILSASVDKTAKLWTVDGQYVGTFGQKQLWNLKSPKTWAYELTNINQDSKHKAKKKVLRNVVAQFKSDIEERTTHMEPQVCINGVPSFIREDSNSSDPIKQPSVPIMTSVPQQTTLQTPRESKETQERTPNLFNFDSIENHRPFLGVRVAKDLARKKMDRQDRRQLYGDINTKQMARFGKICSPFQALATPDVQEIRFPKSVNTNLSRSLTSVAMNEGQSSNDGQLEIASLTDKYLDNSTNNGDNDKTNVSTTLLPIKNTTD